MPIYLDYNASAPLRATALETLSRVLQEPAGNASSIHRFGQAAKARLDDARDPIARLVGGDASEIVFTAGGTEADNLALRGAAAALQTGRRRGIVVSAVEHEAVLNTAKALAGDGWAVTVVPVGASGEVDPDDVGRHVDERTALVAVMLANNETGVIQPVAACARLARDSGAWCLTDAVQAAGKIPLDAKALGVDLLAVSAHKFGGPQGVGALWVRRGLTLRAQLTGGRQERGRRAGTENVAAIAAMGAAAAEAVREAEGERARVAALRDRFERAALAGIDGCRVNGDPASRVPNTSNLSFDRVEGESVVIALDLEGVAVSTGAACSSGSLEPSHVLRAMGLPASRVQSAVRFSLGHATTDAEIDRVIELLPRVVERLRRVAGRRGGA